MLYKNPCEAYFRNGMGIAFRSRPCAKFPRCDVRAPNVEAKQKKQDEVFRPVFEILVGLEQGAKFTANFALPAGKNVWKNHSVEIFLQKMSPAS